MHEKKKNNKPNKQQKPDWHSELVVQGCSRDRVTEPILEKTAIEMSTNTPGIGDIIVVKSW